MLKKSNFKLNIKFIRTLDQKGLGSIFRVLLSSLVVVFFFYSMPAIITFSNNGDQEFKNNSKKILAYTLNNTNDVAIQNQNFNEKDLLVDIFSLNDLDTDTVRLNAATIKQLFEDTNYTLNDVRKKKLLKY